MLVHKQGQYLAHHRSLTLVAYLTCQFTPQFLLIERFSKLYHYRAEQMRDTQQQTAASVIAAFLL